LTTFFLVIRPHAAAASSSPWQPWRFYAWGSGDAASIAVGLADRAGFLLLIFLPLLFLPFLSRMMWLAVAPLGEVLLSRMPTTYAVGTHYAGAWIGYVLVAFAFAVRDLPPRRERVALLACVALCVIEFLVADPLHPGLNLRPPQRRDSALDRFLRSLPADSSVATQEEAYTHLALGDPYARLLPESAGSPVGACFVLIDTDFPDSARLQEFGAPFEQLVRDGRYVPVARSDGIVLYRSTERSCASASPARAGQSSSARTMRCGAAHGAQRATCKA
jgi:uncharacterized membrane protein